MDRFALNRTKYPDRNRKMRQHVWLPVALSELSAGVVADVGVGVGVDVVVAVAVVVVVVVAAAACFLCLRRPVKIVHLCQFVWCVYFVIMRCLFCQL